MNDQAEFSTHHDIAALRVAVFVRVKDRHVRTFGGEGQRHRPPDPTVAAGDDCPAARQL